MNGIIRYLFLSILLAYGCATWSDKSINDVKISQIEVNTVDYQESKYKDKIEKFEQKVIEQLKIKGYNAFVGSRIAKTGVIVEYDVKEVISKSTADAFMFIRAPKIVKVKTYQSNTPTGEELWQLNVVYWLYDRKGEILLLAPKQFLWKDTMPIQRKAVLVEFKDEKAFLAGSGKYRFLETEEEFRTRIAKEFTDNIPNKQ